MKFWVFIVGLVCVCSCKKELTCENVIQLTDEKTSFLVGEWQWAYTERIRDYGTGSQIKDTIYQHDIKDRYSVCFTQAGKMRMLINEEVTNEFCIIDSASVNPNSNESYMNLYLSNNDEENSLTFIYHFGSDVFLLNIKNTKFPFYYEVSNDEQIFYKNYFRKQ